MLRIPYLLLIGAAAAQGLPDAVFDRIPFNEWLKNGGDAHIRWSMEVSQSHLTAHQRLSVLLSVRIDGEEFLKRSGPGQMVVFMEFRDREDRVFRTHQAMPFEELKNPADLASVNFAQSTFILPGEYQIAVAVFDTKSKEHSLKRVKLHVRELPRDPLPGAWRDLPGVEFVTATEHPDGWFLPGISSRLNLPVENERPVRVEVMVNESPTELATRRMGRALQRNMSNAIPALKVLSQIELRRGELNVTLLDLERRKVSFQQERAVKLDWTRLKAALLDNDPNQIDVHALENHEQNAQFFVSEIRKRLESADSNEARVLIVLSGPMAFPKGQDLRPIEAAPEPGARVFYVRYYPPPGFQPWPERNSIQPRGRAPFPPGPSAPGAGRIASTEDSLARTLKPLAPRIFDVTTPAEFRNALAAIISEISRLK